MPAATLQRLLGPARPQPGALGVLTVELADATGYGRIVRNAAGDRSTASSSTRMPTRPSARIREVYTGIMAAPTAALKRWLARLRNDNAQGEYYLTDIVAHGRGRRRAGRGRAAASTTGKRWASTAACSWPSWSASTSARRPTR